MSRHDDLVTWAESREHGCQMKRRRAAAYSIGMACAGILPEGVFKLTLIVALGQGIGGTNGFDDEFDVVVGIA